MNKVTTINLNGRAYQIEDAGYAVLEKYLTRATAKLDGNPDKDEIIADFEQAVAEKCDTYLNPGKTVVTAAEVERIIAAMGPVDAPTNEAAGDAPAALAPKRLYRIHEGEILAGVCSGLAAYFDVDVTIVRLIFVGLTLLTHGPWAIVYVILAIVIPYAETAEERAAAHGTPFNAREFIERAKASGRESLEHGKAWGRRMREDWKCKGLGPCRHDRRDARRARTATKTESDAGDERVADEYRTHVLSHSSFPLLGLAGAILTVLWIIDTFQIITRGRVFGWDIPADVPRWVAVLALAVLFNFALWPIRTARHATWRREWAHHRGHGDLGRHGMLDTVMWLAVFAICGWIAYAYVPAAHAFMDKLPGAFDLFTEALRN